MSPELTNARRWLCAALTARPLPAPMPATEALMRTASQDGVLALLADRLAQHPQFPQCDPALLPRLQAWAKQAARRSLLQQAEQARVYQALQAAGIRFLVLKGAALAQWLYAQPHHRLITDIDLLVADRAEAQRMQAVMQALGYRPRTALAEVHDHEWAFYHAQALTVDVHWDVFNSPLLAGRFSFAELWAERLKLPGPWLAYGLSPVHALINAGGHRASNLPYTDAQGVQRADCLRWLWDIHAVAESLDAPQWDALCAQAAEKSLSAILSEALSTTQSQLATRLPNGVCQRLAEQARGEPMRLTWFRSWWRFQIYRVYYSHPDWAGRLRYLFWRIWPKAHSLGGRYGDALQDRWPKQLKRLRYGLSRLFGGQK